MEDFRKEIELLGALNHANVLKIFCACTVSPYLCFVSEYMERGSLFDVMRKQSKNPAVNEFTWPRRHAVLSQSAAGLEYLHSLSPKVVHRDLKSMNILIGADWNTRIADFGISRYFFFFL